VLLPQFFEKDFCENGHSVRKQPQMENLACLWIHGGVQSELLVGTSNHGFVTRDLIRRFAADGL